MSRTLVISDNLYRQLESISQLRGLSSIEELLKESVEVWQAKTDDLQERAEIVQRIDALREQLYSRYGEQPDSTELIRADRDR